jgi:hypothetical protein
VSLEEDLYEFLRYGDEYLEDPELYGLNIDLGPREHAFLAKQIADWIERRGIYE